MRTRSDTRLFSSSSDSRGEQLRVGARQVLARRRARSWPGRSSTRQTPGNRRTRRRLATAPRPSNRAQMAVIATVWTAIHSHATDIGRMQAHFRGDDARAWRPRCRCRRGRPSSGRPADWISSRTTTSPRPAHGASRRRTAPSPRRTGETPRPSRLRAGRLKRPVAMATISGQPDDQPGPERRHRCAIARLSHRNCSRLRPAQEGAGSHGSRP